MFIIRMKSAAVVALLAWAVVLVAPGLASAQSDRPPGLKGYALAQWMDAHRTRPTPSVYTPSFGPTVSVRPSLAYPKRHSGYTPYTLTLPADPNPVWVAPVRLPPCGGR